MLSIVQNAAAKEPKSYGKVKMKKPSA